MTPEREKDIRGLLQSENPDTIAHYGSNGIYQYAKDVRTAAMDLLAHSTAQAAEIERLKGEVERLTTIVTCADTLRDTLRTHLQSLVEAGDGYLEAKRRVNRAYADGLHVTGKEQPEQEAGDKLRALASAVKKAKEVVG